jgi:hypothetical protein
MTAAPPPLHCRAVKEGLEFLNLAKFILDIAHAPLFMGKYFVKSHSLQCIVAGCIEQGVYIIRWDFDEDFLFYRVQFAPCRAEGADVAN